VYAKSPGGVHYFISVREGCFQHRRSSSSFSPSPAQFGRVLLKVFRKERSSKTFFLRGRAIQDQWQRKICSGAKKKPFFCGSGFGQITRERRHLLCLLLVFLCAAGSKIASAATNPQDGNYFFFIILVNFRCRKYKILSAYC
jgi:hypothetical protein